MKNIFIFLQIVMTFILLFFPAIFLLTNQYYSIVPKIIYQNSFIFCLIYWLLTWAYILFNVIRLKHTTYPYLKRYELTKFGLIISIYMGFPIVYSLHIIDGSYLQNRFIDFTILFLFSGILFYIYCRLHYLGFKYGKNIQIR